MKKNKNNILKFMELQALVMLYSGVSVMSKVSSNTIAEHGIFSLNFIICIGIMFFILGIYGIFWQVVIKGIDISVAYMSKSTGIFWSLLWSYLIFQEHIKISQVIGLFIVMIGVRVSYQYEN